MDKKLIIVGVGHVFNIGDRIAEIISKEEPEAIAIELDEKRAIAIEKRNDIKKKREFSFYYFLASYQENIAKKLGMELGREMITAMEIAKRKGLPLFYIDKDAGEVVNKLWNEISLKEKLSLFFALFLSLFRSKKGIEKELNEIKDKPDEIIDEIGKKFPKIKKILVDERDEHMANSLINLSEKYNKIVAIVGEGHVNGISKIIDGKVNFEIIHLKDII